MSESKVVGICVECFSELKKEDELLPDYPKLYECRECGHPSDVIEDED